LCASDLLHGSESLCKLLRYLSEQSIDHPGAPVKEYQIATEVFKRPPNFDPRMDSTVRVQTGRLRSKLAEYYARADAEDAWVIEIPKGSYSIAFQPRTSAPQIEMQPAAPPMETTAVIAAPRANQAWMVAVVTLSALLAISVIAQIVMFMNRPNNRTVNRPDAPAALVTFWNYFIDSPDEPLVVFSNAEFVGRPETGMHYYNAQNDRPQPILDHYTGVGEVLGMHELDRVFTLLHHTLRVKRGRLLTMDDAKNSDLIFVGSPSENLSLREIPTTQDFVFRRVQDGPRRGDLSIVNVHPKSDEQKVFLSTAQLPLTEDYAVVGLVPGLSPSRWVLVLAGLTTLGTQAAVEYVSRANTVEDLLRQMQPAVTGGNVPPFEAVLEVKVSGGVPVHSAVVALHVMK
jgi:hypothetical protein